MKRWRIEIDYLFGLTAIVEVEANTARKAEIKAKEKLKKEKGDYFMFTKSIEIIEEKSING